MITRRFCPGIFAKNTTLNDRLDGSSRPYVGFNNAYIATAVFFDNSKKDSGKEKSRSSLLQISIGGP